jgi:hypothetical protein
MILNRAALALVASIACDLAGQRRSFCISDLPKIGERD